MSASLTISRILHAGYVFACGGTAIAFDPIFENPFSRNCHAFPDVRFDHGAIRALRFDAVFISHFHDDHCSFESLDLLDRATPLHIYCLFDELFDLVAQLGFTNVHRIALDVPVDVGPIQVTAREALDSEVDSLFQVQAAGMNVLNVVDSWIGDDTLAKLAAQSPWDMVLWPFQTMRETDVLSPSRATPAERGLPPEWLGQLRALSPRYVVPSSCQFVQEPWSWYNQAFFPITYRRFHDEVEAAVPGARVVRMDPSVSFVLDAFALLPAAPLPWVIPVGAQDVDYAYDPAAEVPPTSAIAQRFPALTAEQASIAMDYCREGLLQKYRSMELAPDSYFDTARAWRLSVFDHAGMCTTFDYLVEGDSIEGASHAGAPLSWTTEIAAAKLYAALELGEALSSLYLRINDTVFDEATEEDLELADIVDDPLIRCLYDDVFGAYQAAQLKRLQRSR